MRLRLVLIPCLLTACKPDVIFLTVDTLRADHISALNPQSPVPTPHIDALAADSVTFTQAYSPISVTAPAFCTLMTGQDPSTHGVLMNWFRGGSVLPEDAPMLAVQLHDRGWQTGAFVSGFTLHPAIGFERGFQVFDGPDATAMRRPGDHTADEAIRWMVAMRGRIFLWFHTYDTHGPYTYGSSELGSGEARWSRSAEELAHIPVYQRIDDVSDPAFYSARYARGVVRADDQVGQMVAALKEDGRYNRAMIVFLADHGESLDERDLWFDHGTSAATEQLHIPLMIKLPGGERAGERIDALVSLADVVPAVLDWLDIDDHAARDGRSLWGPLDPARNLVGEDSHCKREPALECAPKGPRGKMFATRDAHYTLIREPRDREVVWRTYDRQADPRELAPLADPPALEALHARLDTLAENRERTARMRPAPVASTSEESEEIRALRALGYVDSE